MNDANLERIGALIYETDPYIYPAMFSSKQDAVTLLKAVIRADSDAMFCKDNFYAALEDGRITGILLWLKGALNWDAKQFQSIANRVSVALPDTFPLVCNNYFSEYSAPALDGVVSLVNICVSQNCRGKGIGKRLVASFFHDTEAECYELFCLEDNERAIALYKAMGFQVTSRQKAFTVSSEEVYSVKMECRRKEGNQV